MSYFYLFCRLQRPNNCPNNGTRPENCKECRSNLYKEAGNTTYTKIRIDLTSLKVISKYTSCTPDYLKKPKRLLLNWCHGLIKANYVYSLFFFYFSKFKIYTVVKEGSNYKTCIPCIYFSQWLHIYHWQLWKDHSVRHGWWLLQFPGELPSGMLPILSPADSVDILSYRETFFFFALFKKWIMILYNTCTSILYPYEMN